MVDHVDLMTQGMPNNGSTLLLYYIYQVGYFNYEQGLASALTILLLIIMMIVNLPRFFRSDKRVYYN
jgi:sn-glycerol 3-phosphate transport system permease protein